MRPRMSFETALERYKTASLLKTDGLKNISNLSIRRSGGLFDALLCAS